MFANPAPLFDSERWEGLDQRDINGVKVFGWDCSPNSRCVLICDRFQDFHIWIAHQPGAAIALTYVEQVL